MKKITSKLYSYDQVIYTHTQVIYMHALTHAHVYVCVCVCHDCISTIWIEQTLGENTQTLLMVKAI